MHTPIGIDLISYYVPSLYLPIEKLAKARNIEYAKLNKGLGLQQMALCDVDEDVATMAAEAALRLIRDNNLDPAKIGRIYLGTESALDAAKPTASYVMHVLEQQLEGKFGKRAFKNCDVLDMTFACVGGVDALLSCKDWIAAGDNRQALVIAADLAKYDLASTGEYTQGAGAVAMLISKNPSLVEINNEVGVATESVSDFFKPRRNFNKSDLLVEAAKLLGQSISDKEAASLLDSTENEFWGHPEKTVDVFREEPVFDGQYSNSCYQNRIFEALDHLTALAPNTNVLEDWKHIVFHLPYAYQGRRMLTEQWVNWVLNSSDRENFLTQIELPLPARNSDEWTNFVKVASKTPIYKEFITERIERGERASSRIGNMYTASIFMSLLSLLKVHYDENNNIEGDTIGFFSYGSGSKSKVFTATVCKPWRDAVSKLHVFAELDNRHEVDFETYELLHKKEVGAPIVPDKKIQLNRIGIEGTETGYRFYATN